VWSTETRHTLYQTYLLNIADVKVLYSASPPTLRLYCTVFLMAFFGRLLPGKLSRTNTRQAAPSKLPSAQISVSAFAFMSHTQSAATPFSNFQPIISNALDIYRKRTKNDLLTHPLAARLQNCDTPAAILAILREQLRGLDQSQSSAEQWSKWLDPTVNVLFTFSATIGAGVSLVCLRTGTHPRSPSSYSFRRCSLPRL
jgi:hypothetical protein